MSVLDELDYERSGIRKIKQYLQKMLFILIRSIMIIFMGVLNA